MVDWNNEAVEARLHVISMNITFLLLGLYGWEYLQSFGVEYAVIRGRLSFRWALIPYIVGRLFLFIFLLLLVIRTNPPSIYFNCLPGAISTAVAGDIALGCCSLNLFIRTWVIWGDSRRVHLLLTMLALGHWIVLALDIANLQPSQRGECLIQIVNPSVNAAVFVYSLCYDLIVLILSIWGLSRKKSKSTFIKRLRQQGVWYFVVTVVTYIPPTVFAFLGVNIMLAITGLFATTASTIASCRAVRSLLGLRPGQESQVTEESLETEVALTTQIPMPTTVPTVV